MKGGGGRAEGQGRVVRFMEGWGWPDEGQEKLGGPQMIEKGQGLMERPVRVKRARDLYSIDSQGGSESQRVL